MNANNDIDVLASAARVLRTEADALLQLADNLPPDFKPVIDLILESTGRVIVSGMGKSGHVGHKISATLASTGTPSMFVHPAEASHGDLGMITPQDVCVLLSNSGETTELGDVVAHTRRFKIPLIGVSRRMDSTLMRAADFRLLLPDAPEACAIGMAPTTSTTLTLALGDALAVALMERRGFQPEHFATFHPGGKLGAQMASVAQLMHGADRVPTVPAHAPMADALIEMSAKGFGMTAVVENGKLAGIVTDGDLRRHLDRLQGATAGEVATRNPITVGPTELAASALAILNDKKINVLVVVDDENRPLGILHIHDLLRAGVA